MAGLFISGSKERNLNPTAIDCMIETFVVILETCKIESSKEKIKKGEKMETRELKLKFFHNAIDRFFNTRDTSKLKNLQTILDIGANLLNNSEEDYEYLLNAFS